MKVVNTTTIIFVLWLLSPLYWTSSQCALSHPSHLCHAKCQDTSISIISQKNNKPINYHTPLSYATYQNSTKTLRTLVNNWEKNKYINFIFFLAAYPLQAPLVHKWNGDMSRTQRRTSMDMHNNTKLTLSLQNVSHTQLGQKF